MANLKLKLDSKRPRKAKKTLKKEEKLSIIAKFNKTISNWLKGKLI